MREFLKGLELDKETIDTIMAEHGKLITESKEKATGLEDKVKSYETKIADLEKLNGDSKKIQEELDTLKSTREKEETERKEKENDEILTKNIKSAFGEKKFVNSFTESAIISEVKSALKDSNNQGKSAKELFEELTKDKEDLFASDNSFIDMGGDKPIDKNLSKETHDRELIGLPIEDKK